MSRGGVEHGRLAYLDGITFDGRAFGCQKKGKNKAIKKMNHSIKCMNVRASSETEWLLQLSLHHSKDHIVISYRTEVFDSLQYYCHRFPLHSQLSF